MPLGLQYFVSRMLNALSNVESLKYLHDLLFLTVADMSIRDDYGLSAKIYYENAIIPFISIRRFCFYCLRKALLIDFTIVRSSVAGVSVIYIKYIY